MPEARALRRAADAAIAVWIIATFLLFYLRLAALLWAAYGDTLHRFFGEAGA